MKSSPSYEASSAVSWAVNVRIRDTVKSLVDATAPLYQPDRRRQPSLLGSGVFFQVANERFLLTAAHVFDNAASDAAISAGAAKQIVNLPTFRWRTTVSPAGGADRFDVTIVPLGPMANDEFRSCRFLALKEVASFREPEEAGGRTPYLLMGYPRTAQPRQAIEGKLAAVPHPVMTHALPLSKFAHLNIEPASHLVVGYNRKDFFDFGISHEQRHPCGMSGGGVWRLDNLWSTERLSARLVAIICEYHKAPDHAVVATRVNLPLCIIQQEYPRLRGVIDDQLALSPTNDL